MEIVYLLLLIYCIKYIDDRFKDKRENIGIDNATIIGIVGLILMIIF